MPQPQPRPSPAARSGTPRLPARSGTTYAAARALPRSAADSLLLHLLLLATLAALAVLLAGCEGVDEREPEEIGQPPGAAAVEEPGAATGAGAAEATSTSEVEVRLHDRMIEMPSSLPAGETTFTVANTGTAAHGFEVEGQGIERAIERIEPGASDTLTVTLQPGTYTVYCPVEDHRAEGMETQLRVIR